MRVSMSGLGDTQQQPFFFLTFVEFQIRSGIFILGRGRGGSLDLHPQGVRGRVEGGLCDMVAVIGGATEHWQGLLL